MHYVLWLILSTISPRIALAQRFVSNSPVTRVVDDSVRLASTTSQQYDFYYSTKQAEQYKQISMASYTREDQIKKHRFRDKIYTEVVPRGLNHLGVFDDYVLLGSGTMAESKDNGDW